MRLAIKRAAVGAMLLSAGLLIASGGCDRGEDATAGDSARKPDPPPAQTVSVPEPQPSPVSLNARLTTIFKLIGRRQTVEARNQLAAYLSDNTDDGRAEFLVGLSYHREKSYARARPHFVRATEHSPGYHQTYHFLGWCLYYLGDARAARDAFKEHLAFVPDEGDSHFGIGLIDLDEDRLDDAQVRFQKAIELQVNNQRRRRNVAKAHVRLADVYVRRNQLEDARDHLETATSLWPQHYAAFYKLSRVRTRLGEAESAKEAFDLYRLWQERVAPKRGLPERPP